MSKDEIAEAKIKLAEMNQTISEFDPAIRLKAFEILMPFYFKSIPKSPDEKRGKDPSDDRQCNERDFFSNHSEKKPDDNVHLVVAWYYSQYGNRPITTKDVKKIAEQNDLIIPNRPDMTIKSAKNNKGKELYTKKGKGFLLTVHGETFIREKYNVRKGTKQPITEDDQ